MSKQDISPSGKHYCILYGDLYTKYLNRIHKIDSRTNVENNLVLGEQGDIILPLSGETPTDISNSAVLPFNNIALGSDIIVFRPIDQNSLFLSYQISWKRKLDIAKIAQGKTIVHSSPKSLSKIFVFCPHLKEQEKISNFLSLIDEKIINMSSKIQVLKKYKEGLINSWFNYKGNTVKLNTLVNPKVSQLLTNQIKNNFGKYIVYDASGAPYKKIDFFNNSFNSIAIIKYGSGCGRTFLTFGNHSVLGTMIELVPKNINDLEYIYAFTQSNIFKRTCKKYIEIGTTPNLYFSDYGSSNLYYPINKIKFITSIKGIENRIIRHEEMLDSLHKLKKQLLNDLFI